MSYNILRGQIKTLLDAQTNIQEVKGYPTLKFNGYPAASVTPSDNDADYETTSENIRTYAFIVRVFYDTKAVGIEGGIDSLEEIVDDVIDAFDQEDLKGSSTRTLGINLPSAYTYINVWASPSVWAEVEGEDLVMAEINVRVRISIDIS